MASGKLSPDQWVNHILCQAFRKSTPGLLIPLDRQMKSVTTQTQMLPHGCKVAYTCTRWNHTQEHEQTHKSLLDICVYSHMLRKHTHTLLSNNHPLTHPYRYTYTHVHTHASVRTITAHAQKDRSFTHTLSDSSFMVPHSQRLTAPPVSKAPVYPPW